MSQPQSFDQRVNQYLDQEISADEFDLLCKELATDPALRQRFLKLSALDAAIANATDHRDRRSTIEAVLANAEESADEDSIFTLYKSIEPRVETLSGPAIRRSDILPLAGYVARLALRDSRVVKGLVAAALLVIGTLLTIVLIGSGQEPQSNPLASEKTPIVDGPDEAPELLRVASLTDERDAVWDRRPGQDLFAGQRFTLTQGFAEITTSRGAIAILQAPATIEFTDNDNALRLHSGKLVGICETESSKGFVVHTPHMHVTDLGTRFGVSSTAEATQSTVLMGSVSVGALDSSQRVVPINVAAGQSAIAGRASRSISLMPTEQAQPIAFVSDWQATQDLHIEGDAAFRRGLPIRLDLGQTESDQAVVFLERAGVTLKQDLVVTLDRPGIYQTFTNRSSQVSAGNRIDSYLVHLDRPGQPESAAPAELTIVFDHPILGVVATDPHMLLAEPHVGMPGVLYASRGDEQIGVEGSGFALDNPLSGGRTDTVQIHPDRRQLTLKLNASRGTDQFRVIVQAQENNIAF